MPLRSDAGRRFVESTALVRTTIGITVTTFLDAIVVAAVVVRA
jgi:hypothetical protein